MGIFPAKPSINFRKKSRIRVRSFFGRVWWKHIYFCRETWKGTTKSGESTDFRSNFQTDVDDSAACACLWFFSIGILAAEVSLLMNGGVPYSAQLWAWQARGLPRGLPRFSAVKSWGILPPEMDQMEGTRPV